MGQFDLNLMRAALDSATSDSSKDLPIGAVISDGDGLVLASAKNAVVANNQVTAHAELLAIASLDVRSLKSGAAQMSLVVTLEPCPMCAWAIRSSGIGRLVFGASNPKYGAAGSVYDLLRDNRFGRGVEVVGGVLEAECQALLGAAFLNMRNNSLR